MTSDATDLVGAAQICAELDIDRATLARWVARGIARPVSKLPGRNGAFVFDADEIERLRELRGDRKQMPQGLEGQVPA